MFEPTPKLTETQPCLLAVLAKYAVDPECHLVTDPDHWSEYGIFTAEQLSDYFDDCIAREYEKGNITGDDDGRAADIYRKSLERFMNRTTVDCIDGIEICRGDYSRAFDAVKNPENWKLPVDAILEGASEFDAKIVKQAVIFFCGCIPEVTRLPNGKLKVTAPGYYIAVGV